MNLQKIQNIQIQKKIILKTEKITIEDSIKCMIKATSKNLIGQICDTHLSFADESLYKAKDPKCIKLCKLFNQEIDASKTGNFIDSSILQNEGLIKKKRPDFLSNGIVNKKRIYESPGILGKLYRKIDKKKYIIFLEIIFLKRQLEEIILQIMILLQKIVFNIQLMLILYIKIIK